MLHYFSTYEVQKPSLVKIFVELINKILQSDLLDVFVFVMWLQDSEIIFILFFTFLRWWWVEIGFDESFSFLLLFSVVLFSEYLSIFFSEFDKCVSVLNNLLLLKLLPVLSKSINCIQSKHFLVISELSILAHGVHCNHKL
jgi:hypothetical protein